MNGPEPTAPREPSTAARRAAQVLQCAIDDAVGGARTRLPPIQVLARTGKVSLVTMWKQVRVLADNGTLSVRPRLGISLAGAPDERRVSRASIRRRACDIADLIRRACAEAQFAPGEHLPPAKVIASRYGVSLPTVFRALGALISDGTVARQGRRYSVARGMPRPGTAGTVVLVASGDADGTLNMVTPRTHNHLRAAERACSARGLTLRTITNTQVGVAMKSRQPWWHTSVNGRDVAGYVVWPIGFSDENQVAEVTTYVARLGRPVALLAEHRDDSMVRANPLPGVRTFALDVDETAGYRVGCYLRRLGHRRVAFVQPGSVPGRVSPRCAGVRRALRESFGETSSVVALCSETPYVIQDDGRHVAELASVIRAHAGPQLRERLALDLVDEGWLGSRLWSLIIDVESRRRLSALAGEALAHTEVTAIVGASDQTAIALLAPLRACKRRVPAMVSVVGFDNGLEAAAQQLTTYDFGGNAAVAAMIDSLVSPKRSVYGRLPLNEVIVMPGTVVTRQTTAACPPGMSASL